MRRRPKKIMHEQSKELRERLANLNIQIPDDYEIYVTDTAKGWHNRKNQTITVPLWAYNALGENKQHQNDPEYVIYYACHEIAHALAPLDAHGPKFMKAFMEICPNHLHHYELNYKPRNAKAAGISQL
jgi:hypothetical protein